MKKITHNTTIPNSGCLGLSSISIIADTKCEWQYNDTCRFAITYLISKSRVIIMNNIYKAYAMCLLAVHIELLFVIHNTFYHSTNVFATYQYQFGLE